MNCPKCNAVMMVEGVVRCATGDAQKFNSIRCRAVFYFDAPYRSQWAERPKGAPEARRDLTAVQPLPVKPRAIAGPAREFATQ